MEIEFFGAQGTTEPYELPADCFQFDDASTVNAQDLQIDKYVQSGFKIKIQDITTGKEIIQLDKVPIT
jgi:fructose 1,6-bisphosphatase